MKKVTLFLFLAGLLTVVACRLAHNENGFPDPVLLQWRHIENQYRGKSEHLAELTIINQGTIPLSNQGWTLHFNWFRRLRTDSMDHRISGRHINGDFYAIAPTADFPVLKPGASVTIPVIGQYYEISITDAPSGAYFVWNYRDQEERFRESVMEILPFDTSKCYRSERDIMPVWNPAGQYARNRHVKWIPMTDEVPGIVPTPVQAEFGDTLIELSADWAIEFNTDCETEAEWFLSETQPAIPGFPAESSGQVISLRIDKDDFSGSAVRAEAYRLQITTDRIAITGYDAAGVFYGLQTVLALRAEEQKQPGVLRLPACRILDYPRFGYRGMHIDVARNFHNAEVIRGLIDVLAQYKLNRLHLHLTDDEGWRLEIPGLPELTEIGAVRGHTLDETGHLVPSLGSGPYTDPGKTAGSGYYSRDTFISLLQYAAARHMEVIPEIDLPGHAHAAIVAMNARYRRLSQKGNSGGALEYLLYHPQDTSRYESVQKWKNNTVDAGMESTYRFFEKVVAELDQMYTDAGLKLKMVHIGGDEVPDGAWKGSPACRNLKASNPDIQTDYDILKYFVERASRILKRYDIRTAGWEEIGMRIEHGKKVPDDVFARSGVVPYVWNSVWGWGGEDLAYRMANQGFDVVLSNVTNLYLDMACHKHPEEPGLYWGGFVNTRTTWELTPTDVRLCAETDLNGHNIDVTSFDRFEPLKADAEAHIIGIQGQVWGENARSTAMLHYLMFPKTLGLSERAWARKPSWEKQASLEKREEDWHRFVMAVGLRELPRLSRRGIAYRIPLPGAIIRNDTLYVNNMYPGFTAVYRLNEGPAEDYSTPVYLQGKREEKRIRIWNRDGTGRESREVRINQLRIKKKEK